MERRTGSFGLICLSVKMKSVMGAALLAALSSGVATAADMPTKAPPAPIYSASWFFELEVGAGFGRTDSLLYNNPVGTAFTTNPVVGNDIILLNTNNTDKSLVAAAAVGYFLTDNIYVKGAYRYFGKYNTFGFSTFPPIPFAIKQDMTSTAHGAFLGFGIIHDLTQKLYLDASVELGAAFVQKSGIDDSNTDIAKPFPKSTTTKLAAGVGLGLGYRITPRLDLIFTGNYHRLGNASTGIMCHCIVGTPGENAQEQLRSDFSVISVIAGIRLKF